jgi:hypothetical protein
MSFPILWKRSLSSRPLAVFSDLAIGLRESARSLNQNRADENQNSARSKLYKPPPIDIIRLRRVTHEYAYEYGL